MNLTSSRLLTLLSDSQLHSGSEIAETIGVSRTAVWKNLQKLSILGLEVEAIKGKGYRLKNGFELLDKKTICAALRPEINQYLSDVDVLMDVTSTNDVAMQRVNNGQSKGYVCLAEYQKKGRGRRGRQWVSPFGHNIYLSLVWEFAGGVSQFEGLSLAVGVVVAQTLENIGLQRVSLKWPNDILLSDCKLGGVLLEMSGDPVGICQVVIGIGLNVRMPESVDIDQPWSSIAEQLPAISRNELIAELLNSLVTMLVAYTDTGFSSYLHSWEALDAYRGKEVCIVSGASVINGVANGVFDNGALRLLVDGKDQLIHGGEVSLRICNDS